MKALIRRLNGDRAELWRSPHGPVIATGSQQAVESAANLLLGKNEWDWANLNQQASMDMIDQEDRRVFDACR